MSEPETEFSLTRRWLQRQVCAAGVLLLVLAPAGSTRAQFIVTTNGGALTIDAYTGAGGAVDIPSEINGLPVTSIADMAFWNCTSLTSVSIPNSVTNIGDSAFFDCYALTNAPIPSSVTSIGFAVFVRCASLTGITVDELNESYSSVDGVLFNKSQTSLLEYPVGPWGSTYAYSIPDSVTSIGEWAFEECWGLASVTIPNSVTNIGDWAFNDCTVLTNVAIPGSAASIGTGAFWLCSSLTSVAIPSSVTSIGDTAFWGCHSLAAIEVDALNPFYSSLGGVLFNKSQTSLIQYPPGKLGSAYIVPSGVITIGDYAFYGCQNLTSVAIPSSVTSVEDEAFCSCYALTNVTIGSSVTNLADYAFCACLSLTGIYFTGNAPGLLGLDVFDNDGKATVYYLSGATGWGSTFGGLPAVLWNPQAQTGGADFGALTNGFGFTIAGASNLVLVVEACTNLANPVWFPVSTNALTGGAAYFSDAQWTNYPCRFYRFRSP